MALRENGCRAVAHNTLQIFEVLLGDDGVVSSPWL